MELFHQPNIDWMGKKWLFIGLSLALALAGLISMVLHRGLVYGIDFRGGTVVRVKFSQVPNLDKIRKALEAQGLRNVTLQRYGAASDHEVVIDLDLQTTASSDAIDKGKRDVLNGFFSISRVGGAAAQRYYNTTP